MTQALRDTLKRCSGEEYAAYIRTLRHEQSRPAEGHAIGVMQWVDQDSLIIAQAIYQNGSVQYQIKITK